jgi:ABC-type transporter Mla MlaB component
VATLEERSVDATHASRSCAAAGELHLVVAGAVTRVGIASLCDRVRALVREREPSLVVVDVAALAAPDAATIDAIARLQLTARGLGRAIRFRHACPEIHELVGLMGLGDVLRLDAGSGQTVGQTEQREQARGVEEERDT